MLEEVIELKKDVDDISESNGKSLSDLKNDLKQKWCLYKLSELLYKYVDGKEAGAYLEYSFKISGKKLQIGKYYVFYTENNILISVNKKCNFKSAMLMYSWDTFYKLSFKDIIAIEIVIKELAKLIKEGIEKKKLKLLKEKENIEYKKDLVDAVKEIDI